MSDDYPEMPSFDDGELVVDINSLRPEVANKLKQTMELRTYLREQGEAEKKSPEIILNDFFSQCWRGRV